MRSYSPGGALNAFATARKGSIPPTPSAQRLRPGLPGYLIPFAPLAFVPERQLRTRASPSPRVFLLISTHFTATPGIPRSPPALKSSSIGSRFPVEPWTFHFRLKRPPAHPLHPIIPNNARSARITAAAGTDLAGASLLGTVGPGGYYPPSLSPPAKAVYDPKIFILHAASHDQSFLHCRCF